MQQELSVKNTPTDHDRTYLRRAIQLARQAQQRGNLPIGALIVLDGTIVAQGQNAAWHPVRAPARHAEMEALHALPPDLLPRAGDMTLYTTLEPCLMCLGAILAHHIGRVVFGAHDPRGGALFLSGHLPPAFDRAFRATTWLGPALPDECDPLDAQVTAIIATYKRTPPPKPPTT